MDANSGAKKLVGSLHLVILAKPKHTFQVLDRFLVEVGTPLKNVLAMRRWHLNGSLVMSFTVLQNM